MLRKCWGSFIKMGIVSDLANNSYIILVQLKIWDSWEWMLDFTWSFDTSSPFPVLIVLT